MYAFENKDAAENVLDRIRSLSRDVIDRDFATAVLKQAAAFGSEISANACEDMAEIFHTLSIMDWTDRLLAAHMIGAIADEGLALEVIERIEEEVEGGA